MRKGVNAIPRDKQISILPVNFTKLNKRAFTIKNKLCGLNLLSYFGLLDENMANELVACSFKSPSIFEIIDYINLYERRNGRMNNQYIAMKRGIYDEDFEGVDVLYDLTILFENVLNRKNKNLNYVTFFKLCTDNYADNGVLASIYSDDKNIYYIDENYEFAVITKLFEHPFEDVSLYDFVSEKYPEITDIDIIYICLKPGIVDFDVYSEEILEFDSDINRELQTHYSTILKRKNEKKYGGKKYKNKKRTNKRLTKKHKKTKYSKNNTKCIQSGGNLDKFEKIMLDIDTQNKIKSAIKIDEHRS
jgi:hypothetical protein